MTRTVSRWVLIFLALPAMAADARWTAVAPPPRPSLPAVSVVLGESGYISKRSSVIELRATASSAAFDGYIGYHLEVAGNKTIDFPVVARAVLQPHQQWSFNTWLQMREQQWLRGDGPKRELVIEWRDRSMSVVAQRVVGTPPWNESSPLRVVRDEESAGPSCCLGVDAQVRRVAELASVAQWYAGFTHLVIATDLWLDLPQPVREAAFSSGIRRIFIGPPRPGQTLTQLDHALLPVEFLSAAGEARVSWRAKRGTVFVGTQSSPDLVDDQWNVFVADASGVTSGLPVTQKVPSRRFGPASPVSDLRVGERIRRDLVSLIGIAVLVLTIAIAVMIVRSLRGVAVVATLAIAVTLIACRDQLRARSQVHVFEDWAPEGAGGAMQHLTLVDEYGPTPIAEHRMRPEDARLTVTRAGDARQSAELRTSTTPPGYGAMFISRGGQAWDSTSRWSRRTEAGSQVRITIRNRDHDSLTFDYEAPFPVQYARARWIWKGMAQTGDGRLGGRARGQVTIRNMRFAEPLSGVVNRFSEVGNTAVALVAMNDDRTAVLNWEDHSESEPAAEWTMGGRLQRDAAGIARCSFVVPRFSPDATMWLQATNMINVQTFTATFAGTVVPLVSDETIIAGRKKVDPAFVKRIATEGGILSIAIDGVEKSRLARSSWVEIAVKENRP